jgi:FixJ family two-component response regulator
MLVTLPTVFVVDDDESVRKALARLFESEGLHVETFAGAQELLTRPLANAHGCILMDIKMPHTTGIELQAKLMDSGVGLPIIFLSAHADVALTVRAMKAGALDVVTKPFKASALLDAVRRAIARDEARHVQQDEYEQVRQRFETLTPREQTVMNLVVAGNRNRQVAALIGASVKTVKVHRSRVMAKMRASSLPELVRMANRLGLPQSADPTDGVPKVQ